jgi:hypothetical protein
MITPEQYQELQDRIARNAAEGLRRQLGFDPQQLIRQLNIQPRKTEPPSQHIKAHAALAKAAGMKPRKERSPAEQRAYQTACMQRYRNERRGEPTDHLPPRMRKPYTKRKEQ